MGYFSAAEGSGDFFLEYSLACVDPDLVELGVLLVELVLALPEVERSGVEGSMLIIMPTVLGESIP